MRVLVTGSRNWTDRQAISSCLAKLREKGSTTLIEGEARGADSIAREEAIKLGYVLIPYPASWSKFGRSAGYIRNQKMLEEGKPDIVVYFNDELGESKGTKDMVRRAKTRNIPVYNGRDI